MEKEKISILYALKEGEKSTTELISTIRKNHYDGLKILNELEKENHIEKIEVGKYTFWRLK